jgi:hypothetical protein
MWEQDRNPSYFPAASAATLQAACPSNSRSRIRRSGGRRHPRHVHQRQAVHCTPRYPMRPKNVDEQGRLRPEQFLTGNFAFDVQGRLVAFNAQGSAAANYYADNQIYEALRSRLKPTDEEIRKILKESGAKYGFKDQKQFRDNLPLSELEKFIGKIEVRSLDFQPIAYGAGDDPVNDLHVWSLVIVMMTATQKDGTKLPYRAFFDHFNGALKSVHEWPDDPSRGY